MPDILYKDLNTVTSLERIACTDCSSYCSYLTVQLDNNSCMSVVQHEAWSKSEV